MFHAQEAHQNLPKDLQDIHRLFKSIYTHGKVIRRGYFGISHIKEVGIRHRSLTFWEAGAGAKWKHWRRQDFLDRRQAIGSSQILKYCARQSRVRVLVMHGHLCKCVGAM